jgi:exodeoxyribonuclease VII large subunit
VLSTGYGGSVPGDAATDRPASSRERPLGIADVVRLAGRTLDALGLVWLAGEVTQATTPASGHLYFSLQDRGSVLAAIMWARDVGRLRFKIEAGQRLRVRGRLGVYDRDGKMQLYADFAEPAGAGAEAAALEQLKAKLAAEGIFAAAKKRALPKFPRRIGVVTSARGAAVHDIIRTVHRRLPTPILIADTAVQGATAPHQIVMGMAMVVRAGVDVVIVGRGGGAATDLTAFNHERVVRTISRCPVPVISAIGHETDLSLADLAADARASTPTAAAELAVPDGAMLADALDKERRRLDREMRHGLHRARQDLDRAQLRLAGAHAKTLAEPRRRLADLQRRLASLHPRAQIHAKHAALAGLEKRLLGAHPARQLNVVRGELGALQHRLAAAGPAARIARDHREIGMLAKRMEIAVAQAVDQRRRELGAAIGRINALSPLAVLERGYATVHAGAAIVRDAGQLARGDRLRVRLARGQLVVIVDEVDE